MSVSNVKALGIVGFGPGVVLYLTPAQAKARAHLLDKAGDGRYSVTGQVQFKAGECFGLEEDALPGLGHTQRALLVAEMGPRKKVKSED